MNPVDATSAALKVAGVGMKAVSWFFQPAKPGDHAGFLWRAWRERQLLSDELSELKTTRIQLQKNVLELRSEEGRLRDSNNQLSINVDELQRSNLNLVGVEQGLRRQNSALDAETQSLKASIATMTEQNNDLLRTTTQLREVLKIAGESSESIQAVEQKLFNAVDDLSALNAQMQANILEQRRRQLRDIFMKFDVDFESKISDPTQLQRMTSYVQAVYHAKMEKLHESLAARGGVLRWDDFEAALLRDNFWSETVEPHQQHLHPS